MSKELEALKYLKENKRKHWLDNDQSQKCLDIIEAALNKYEQYKAFEEEAGTDLLTLIKWYKYPERN